MTRSVVLFVLAIVMVFTVAGPLSARVSYFPFSEVKKGMEGIGKTVFQGTKIEDFAVEVIDVVQGRNIADSYFVIRVKDGKVQSLGGISAGMSGSPIYIKGRIAGALAYNWESRDNLVGVVTPIEAMLAIWKEEEVILPLEKAGSSVFLLHGFRGRAGELLAQNLKSKWSLCKAFTLPSFLFGGKNAGEKGALQPGGAIGIQLLTGDAEIMSIGTLTFRDGDRILALGHPFLHRGKANYFLSSVYVNFSLEGKDFPFKVGTSLETVGMIDQDRGTGVSGRIGVFPETTEVKVAVKEGTRKGEYRFLAVRDDGILLEVLPEVLLDTIDRTIDSQIPGSGNIKLRIERSDWSLEEEFFVWSDSDIADTLSETVGRILQIVLANPYQFIAPERMTFDIEIFTDIQRGWLLSCKFPRIVKRGEPIEGQITFFLYRQGERNIHFPLVLSADFPVGDAEIMVQGKGVSGEEEASPSLESFPPTLEEYLRVQLDEFKRHGVKVEVVAKQEISSNYTTYFMQTVYLPIILEGSFSTKVWVN